MAVGWHNKAYLNDNCLVVIGPEHAKSIGASGLSKQAVKRFLYEHVRRPLGELLPGPDGAEGVARQRVPEGLDAQDDATLIPKITSPDGITVVVAGGTAGRFSLHLSGWGAGSRLATAPVELD